MSRHLALATMAALAMTAHARAADVPKPCGSDPRERCVAYQPGQIVSLIAAPGAALTIELPSAERVYFVGKSDNALVSPSNGGPGLVSAATDDTSADGDLLVTVPKADNATGNMVMVRPQQHLAPQPLTILAWWTHPGTGERSIRRHTFEIRTRPGDLTADTPDTFYAVRFTDPVGDRAVREQKAKEAAEAARAHRAKRDAELAADRLRQTASLQTVRENRAYDGQGTAADRAALAPAGTATLPAIWDDGQRTFLRYPGNRRPPMPYQVFPDGTEALVGQSTDTDPPTNGNVLVLHGVFPMIRLRDGSNVLCIVNRGYDPVGRNPGTGTVSPDVLRVSRSTEATNGR